MHARFSNIAASGTSARALRPRAVLKEIERKQWIRSGTKMPFSMNWTSVRSATVTVTA
jgi:hypothetical protein